MVKPGHENDHPYCDKVIDHDRELGGVQAYLKTVIDGQRKLFERTDDLCDMQSASASEMKHLRGDIEGSKENLRLMIAEEITKNLSLVLNGALDKRKGTEERIPGKDECSVAKGPISGFLDRSWNKFLENIGPIVIGLLLWWLLWALTKTKFFGELPVVKFFTE